MDPQERADQYAVAKAKLRSTTKQAAMARMWEMAREALATRANLGVKELTYSTDLVPGTSLVTVVATERTVELTCVYVPSAWHGQGEGAEEPRGTGDRQRTYVLDEAWLLGVAT